MFTLDANASYQMPAHFGPRPRHPKMSGWYRDVTVMAVPYVTDKAKLAALLPKPFEVAGDAAVITVAYARNRQVDWLAGHGYNLIEVTAAVVFNGEKEQLFGNYTLVMWENLTDPILTGRELQGIPKLYANIPDHTASESAWYASASHFGNNIVDLGIHDLRTPTAQEIAASQAATAGKNHPMAWRYFPGVGGFGSAVNEFTTFPSEMVYTEALVGRGEVAWSRPTWAQNPTQSHIINTLADLPVLHMLPALAAKGSVNLVLPDQPSRVLVGGAA